MKKAILTVTAIALALLMISTPVLAYHGYGAAYYRNNQYNQCLNEQCPNFENGTCYYMENGCRYNEVCQNEGYFNCLQDCPNDNCRFLTGDYNYAQNAHGRGHGRNR